LGNSGIDTARLAQDGGAADGRLIGTDNHGVGVALRDCLGLLFGQTMNQAGDVFIGQGVSSIPASAGKGSRSRSEAGGDTGRWSQYQG
jgi:hypothetical protein